MHADCDAQDLADVANLICQLILRYKEALRGLLAGAVPVFVAAVHALLPADWDWSGRTGQPQTAASGALSLLVCGCCLLTGAVKWLCPRLGRWQLAQECWRMWAADFPSAGTVAERKIQCDRTATVLADQAAPRGRWTAPLLRGHRDICSAK